LEAPRDDGLSVRRARLRHDEGQAPRGHKLDTDGWPLWEPPKGSRKPTDDDRALAHAVSDIAFTSIGEGMWKPGPNDVIMNDAARTCLARAYKALTGIAWGTAPPSNDAELACGLGQLLRLRELARVYVRVRGHRAKPNAPRAEGVAMTGAEIVENLTRMGRGVRSTERPWGLVSEEEAAKLARLIDALPEGCVNLGGAGGPGGGRTPETVAHDVVLALRDPEALRARVEKRRATDDDE
jgi:hypothetical protein